MRGRVITRVLYRRAARQAKLSAEDRNTLESVLENNNYTDVADEVLEDFQRERVGKLKALGDGTLLKLLLENLPAIIAAIIEIIKAMSGGVVTAKVGMAAPTLRGRKRRKARRQKRRVA